MNSLPARSLEDTPTVTAAEMREIDRMMVEDLGIQLIQMMENAGRNLAHLAKERFLRGDPRGRKVVVFAGPGGNGGGALVCARRLSSWGAAIEVYTSAPQRSFRSVPLRQLRILRDMGVIASSTVRRPDEQLRSDLVIDGLIGYSLTEAPRGRAAELIRSANACSAPTLSLDVPSGLDATRGRILEPAVRADATMTLALPKTGLMTHEAAECVGELYLADIGVPPGLYDRLVPPRGVGSLFARGDVIRLLSRGAC